MGFAHGRNDGTSPRPDLVKSGSVGSYGRAVFCECAISDRDSDKSTCVADNDTAVLEYSSRLDALLRETQEGNHITIPRHPHSRQIRQH